MEDHEIYWKAAHLDSGCGTDRNPGPLYSGANPLGLAQVSSWVTVNTDYELNFDLMDHRFSSPSHIILKTSPLAATANPQR